MKSKLNMARLGGIIYRPYWLVPIITAASIAHYALYPVFMDGVSPSPEPLTEQVGPCCAINAAPTLEGHQVIWHLTQPELVLPYDLVLAGYPETASGEHHLVARVTCTAYTSRICETDSTPHITASNKQTRAGYVALSRDLLAPYTPGAPFNFGDRIELIGLGTFQVEDTMAERWERRVDIWFPDLDAAWQWGRRSLLLAGLAEEPDEGCELADPCRLAAIIDPAGDVALLETQSEELGDI